MKETINHVLDSHVLSAVVLVVVGVGAIKSVLGDFGYEEYVQSVSVLVGATAVGRGLAAWKK